MTKRRTQKGVSGSARVSTNGTRGGGTGLSGLNAGAAEWRPVDQVRTHVENRFVLLSECVTDVNDVVDDKERDVCVTDVACERGVRGTGSVLSGTEVREEVRVKRGLLAVAGAGSRRADQSTGTVLGTLMVEAKGAHGFTEVRLLADTGSSRESLVTPSVVKMLGLDKRVRPYVSDFALPGAYLARADKCVDITLRLGGVATTWQFVILDLPVPLLMGLDQMRHLAAVIDLPQGSIEFQSLRVTCPLERYGGSGSRAGGMDAIAAILGLVEGSTGEEDVLAEVARLEAMPDISETAAAEQCAALLREFERLFGDPVGGARVEPVEVRLKEEYKRAAPINIPQRRHTKEDSDRIEAHIEKESAWGFIRRSRSGWNFPTLVAKKEGHPEGRFCVNFQPLSKRLRDDYHWVIPRIRDLLDRVAGARIFSKVDLRAGFKQFKLSEDSQDILSFTGPDGRKWKYAVMPFGVKFASEVFQEGMTRVIGPALLWVLVQLYIDDCLAATKTRRAHLYVLRKLFQRFDEYDVRLARDKCEFMRSEIKWVGHVLDAQGVRPDPEKLHAIKKIPAPRTKEELRKFMHMAQWHLKEYAPLFSKYASKLWPMTSTKKEIVWRWDIVEQEAFANIKSLCEKALMRAHFRDEEPSELYVDASAEDSICAILMQQGRMVMCASRTLNKAERAQHISVKELLAVKYGCKKFRVFILGRRTKVFTDHQALLGIMRKTEHDNKRFESIKADIAEFDLDVEHVPGMCNHADFWTRLGLDRGTDRPDSVVATLEAAGGGTSALQTDVVVGGTLADLLGSSTAFAASWWRVGASHLAVLGEAKDMNWSGAYSTSDMREIKEYGSDVREVSLGMEVRVQSTWRLYVPESRRRGLCWAVHRGRHGGMAAMLEGLRGYHWLGKQRYVQEMLEGCACALAKAGQLPRNKDLKSLRTGVTAPMQLLAIDVFSYNSIDYLTAMDMYSGFPFIKALPNGHSQPEVLEAFEQLVSEIGGPGRLLMDRGAEFGGISGFEVSRTAAYHPEGNGKLERFHKELANLSRVHKGSPVAAIRHYRTEEQRRLFYGRPQAETKALDFGPSGAVRRSFAVGDVVARFIPRRSRAKHQDVWTEPQRVLKVVGDRNYILWNGYHKVTAHVNDIKRVTVPSCVGGSINPTLLASFCSDWGVEQQDLLRSGDTTEALAQAWAGKDVLLPVNLREIPAALDKCRREKPRDVLLVVPELPGEDWWKELENSPAHWIPFPGKEDDLVDERGKGLGVFCFKLWAVLLG